MTIIPGQWYIPDRVIYSKAIGDQTLDEMKEHSQRLTVMLDAGTPLVHVILDDSQMGRVPTYSIGVTQDALSFIRHANIGWVVLVGKPKPILEQISRLLAKITRIRYRRELTFEDAIAFLKEVDQTLNWDNVDNSVLGDEVY